ncbi:MULTISPECIES: maleylpyruvate isomerase family mycothiol-dependent enzyme [unclassified Mycobacteroides]|uniref:maleylpyruvate isomerase family mycothiol-dependent enzyme n=1 Tax=unclassified Mycobacteroides TaxID=2618759 RepID=UPI001EF0CF25|nr:MULTISPECIES: maleylpyruvate isomerase family mycothiol-dependent enzyme [unclassified Mycobacteroides]
MKPKEMLAAERASLAEFLHTLSEDDWLAPSLCDGWTVRDVVAHASVDAVSLGAYLGTALRNPSINKLNGALIERTGHLSNRDLLRHFESAVQPGAFGKMAPAALHTDAMVHHQDIRRPLGRPRTIPEQRLVFALDHPDFGAHPKRYTKGLRFVATDVPGWAKGTGPEVRGTGEALVLAMAGRPVVLGELDGDGVPTLADRMR